MKNLKILSLLFFLFLLSSCSHKATIVDKGDADSACVIPMEYSELLEMESLGHGKTLCRILDPWRTNRVMMQYLLVPSNDTTFNGTIAAEIAEEEGESIVLRTPLQRITLTASCHAWLLSQLNALDRVKVMCDTAFIAARNVQDWMRTAHIADGGTATSPNAEVMLSAQSDALWISPYENSSLGNLTNLPIPVIYCAEYMENSPLGRAEWMRFFGRLVGKEVEADTLFAEIATRYERIAAANAAAKDSLPSQPAAKEETLLAELPYGATWYVPGGRSTSALLYEDAGYDYYWKEDTHAGSLALSKEAVMAKAQDCDLWLFKYSDPVKDWKLSDFVQQHELYGEFKAAKTGNVWACNTATSDFFDVTPFRPDSLLGSLVNKDGSFFRKLQ